MSYRKDWNGISLECCGMCAPGFISKGRLCSENLADSTDGDDQPRSYLVVQDILHSMDEDSGFTAQLFPAIRCILPAYMNNYFSITRF